MDFQDITGKLNELLSGDGRKIVFWYDDDASYAEDVKEMELAGDAKLWILTQDNWFETKLTIEEREPETSS